MPLSTGALLAFAAASCFSLKAIFVKLAYGYGIDAVALLALRMIFSLPLLLGALWYSSRRGMSRLSARDWLIVVFLGIVGYYLSSLLDFLGLHYISAGLERLILFLYPTFVALIAVFVFKRPFGRRGILALILSYGGIALAIAHDLDLAGKPQDVAIGVALVFGCAITYALYIAGSGEIVHRLGALRLAALATSIAGLCVLGQFLLQRSPGELILYPAPVYLSAFGMAAISTVLPIFLMAKAIAEIGAARTAIIGSAGPVVTIFFAWALLGETISLLQILGAAAVLAGVFLVARRETGSPA